MAAKQTVVFVGGPIQYAVRPDGSFDSGTRTIIEQVIAALAERGNKVLSAHRYERFGQMDVSGKFREVCLRDYGWMKECDLFVAVLPLDANGNVIVSSGTSIELGWASAMGKPIILVCDPAPKYSHLIIGLDAVANTLKIDINRPDLTSVLCAGVDRMLTAREKHDHHAAAGQVPTQH
jgi:nucleoside 2-deoxyribosyltransferase